MTKSQQVSMSQTRLCIIAVLLCNSCLCIWCPYSSSTPCLMYFGILHIYSEYIRNTLVAQEPCGHYNRTITTRCPCETFRYFPITNVFKALYECMVFFCSNRSLCQVTKELSIHKSRLIIFM